MRTGPSPIISEVNDSWNFVQNENTSVALKYRQQFAHVILRVPECKLDLLNKSDIACELFYSQCDLAKVFGRDKLGITEEDSAAQVGCFTKPIQLILVEISSLSECYSHHWTGLD